MSKDKEVEAAEFLKKSIGEIELINTKKISKMDSSTLNENDTFFDVLEISRENQKEAVVIIGFNNVVGTINKMEMISKITKENISKLDKIKIKDIMNKNFIFCSPKDNFKKIYDVILKTNFDSIVLKKEDKFFGLLDYFDLIKMLQDTSFEIKNPPLVKEAMKTKIIKIEAKANLLELKEIFIKNNCNYCLVYKDKINVGIVTIKDLIGSIYKNLDLEKIQVQNIMSARIVFMEQWKDLNEAMKISLEKRFNQIPVKEGDKIIGILEIKDAVKVYYEFLKNLMKGDYFVEELL